ncbi:MAG: hypothetical protein M2R45_04582 [Verrucomicrobia subdivision 3 bacterium]|nr:hypothetical protein [Limisphaerales bacterium]MCS1417357.1 hypothetical protein [Limisphaerales bacterium]
MFYFLENGLQDSWKPKFGGWGRFVWIWTYFNDQQDAVNGKPENDCRTPVPLPLMGRRLILLRGRLIKGQWWWKDRQWEGLEPEASH